MEKKEVKGENKPMARSFKEEELRQMFEVTDEFRKDIMKILVDFFTALDQRDSATLARIGESLTICHSNGQVMDIDGVINAVETAKNWGETRKRKISIDYIYYKEGDSLCAVDWTNYMELIANNQKHIEHYKENWLFVVKKGSLTPIRASYIQVSGEVYKEGV